MGPWRYSEHVLKILHLLAVWLPTWLLCTFFSNFFQELQNEAYVNLGQVCTFRGQWKKKLFRLAKMSAVMNPYLDLNPCFPLKVSMFLKLRPLSWHLIMHSMKFLLSCDKNRIKNLQFVEISDIFLRVWCQYPEGWVGPLLTQLCCHFLPSFHFSTFPNSYRFFPSLALSSASSASTSCSAASSPLNLPPPVSLSSCPHYRLVVWQRTESALKPLHVSFSPKWVCSYTCVNHCSGTAAFMYLFMFRWDLKTRQTDVS